MKASELAKILLRNPDAMVMHKEYTGCTTPCLEIKHVKSYKSGESFKNEGGKFIKGDRNGIAQKDLIVLYSDNI